MSGFVYFYEAHAAKDLNESVVGRKGMSLFELKDKDVPVPSFFVISPLIYEDIVFKAFGDSIEKYLKEKKLPDPLDVEKVLMKATFTAEVEEELFKAYAKLSGFNDAWVAVRSSVVYTPNKKVLFSGIFNTEVNVRGFDELLQSVKRIYVSMFKDSVLSYANRHNVDFSQLKMSVVVQKMVQAEVSGVTYTTDLITQDRNKMSMEAVFGLGDVIANAEITPDRYVLNKKDLSFEDKKISPQEWMNIRILNTKGKGGIERINISSSWSHQQKLEDRFLREIAKICLLIEDSFGKPQNVEWVWESGKVWIIQNKSILKKSAPKVEEKKFSNVILDPVLDVLKKKKEEEIVQQKTEEIPSPLNDIEDKIAKLSGKFEELSKKKFIEEKKDIEKKEEKIKKEKEDMMQDISKGLMKENLKMKNMCFLTSGVGISSGTKIGKVMHVNSRNHKDLVVTKENVIILEDIFPGALDAVFLSGGVLMDLGGLSSDVSILCREFSVPGIFGIKNVSKLLQDDDFVKIDANSGGIYIYKEQEKVDEPVDEIDYEILNDEKTSVKKEEKVVEKKTFLDVPTTATKVYISSKDISSLEPAILEHSCGLAMLDLEEMMISEKRHPEAFLNEGKMAEYTNFLAKKIDTISDMLHGNDIIISLGSHRSLDFAELTKGKTYEEGDQSRGVSRYLQSSDLTSIALKTIVKARNLYRNKNISLAFHSPLNGDNMVAIKKKDLSLGLRRNSTFKLYAIIENPSEVILIEDILSANIDGLILNTPALAKQMQGLSLFDEKAVYSLDSNSLFKTIDNIKEDLRNQRIELLGVTENNPNLLKKYIELGFCGVVVDGEKFVEMKKIIADKEAEIVFSRGRF